MNQLFFHVKNCVCGVSDRKKDLVKLQVGEYVALSKVETVLKLSNLVDNVCAYADSAKMFAVCLVIPNDRSLVALAATLGITVALDNWQQLCSNLRVEKAVLIELQKCGRKGGFDHTSSLHEFCSGYVLSSIPFIFRFFQKILSSIPIISTNSVRSYFF